MASAFKHEVMVPANSRAYEELVPLETSPLSLAAFSLAARFF